MSGTNALWQPDAIPGTRDNPLAPPPTWADAATQTAGAVGDYIAQQRALAQQQGVWGPDGITPAGARAAATQVAMAPVLGTTGPKGADVPAPGFTAYHGSPHDFDAFDASKIGTGEGAQAYGHGLYLADAEAVARNYREGLATPLYDGKDYNSENVSHRVSYYVNNLSGGSVDAALQRIDGEITDMANRPDAAADYVQAGIKRLQENRAFIESGKPIPEMTGGGSMYEVHVNADPAHFLDWDKPLSEQHPVVQQAVADIHDAATKAGKMYGQPPPEATGAEVYRGLRNLSGLDYQTLWASDAAGTPAVSSALQQAGIPGIRYLDAGSRGAGDGSRNTVVFDPSIMRIVRKYAIPAAMLSGTGHGLVTGNTQQQ
jgi:hypothetical protein